MNATSRRVLASKYGTMVEISWIDSTEHQGWQYPPMVDWEPAQILTMGRIALLTGEAVTVAHSVSDIDHCVGVLTIPLGCILGARRLVVK